MLFRSLRKRIPGRHQAGGPSIGDVLIVHITWGTYATLFVTWTEGIKLGHPGCIRLIKNQDVRCAMMQVYDDRRAMHNKYCS